MSASETYSPFLEAVKEKIYLSKTVIEFILNTPEAAYEDLLNKMETTVPPSGLGTLTEDTLLRHAQFVCDQVALYACVLRVYYSLLVIKGILELMVTPRKSICSYFLLSTDD